MKTTRLTVLALITVFLAACGGKKKEEVMTKMEELEGTPTERSTAVKKVFAEQQPELPSAITAAHLFEVKTGDGRLGPADYRSFVTFRVPPKKVELWAGLLDELKSGPPEHVAPPEPKEWWLPEADMAKLKFYEPKKLTGRTNGWVGINEENATIFIYTFTM